jgi:hypothetical protein
MTDLITLPRATVQQALEALEEATNYTGCETWSPSMTDECLAVAAALKAALEQPDQGGKTGWPPGLLQDDCRGLSKWLASQPDARRRVREAVAALEQFVHPPRREWRVLSEEEIDAIQWHGSPFQFARAVEAALRSKNYE